MNAHQLLAAAEGMYRSAKEAVTKREGINDLPPLTMVARDGLLMVITGGFENPDVRGHWLSFIGFGTQCSAMALCQEAFIRSTPEGSPPPKPTPYGQFARDFASGDQAVQECMTFAAIDRDDTLIMAQQGFRYKGRHLLLGEREGLGVSEGRIPDDLHRAMQASRDSEAEHAGLANLGAWHEVAGLLREKDFTVDVMERVNFDEGRNN